MSRRLWEGHKGKDARSLQHRERFELTWKTTLVFLSTHTLAVVAMPLLRDAAAACMAAENARREKA